MIHEHESAVLTCDLPGLALRRGDVGTIVMVHAGGRGFEIEFCTLDGRTVAVTTVSHEQVRPIDEGEIACARRIDIPSSAA